VTRSADNQHEFISTSIGHVIIELHEHANTGTVNYQLPIYDEGTGTASTSTSTGVGTSAIKGKLEINLNIISNVEDGLMDDGCSSIGSDLSFIQKEQHQPSSASASASHSSPRKGTNRLVGGAIPEAGKVSNWSFNTTTVLQQETEVKATEISIVKMHLERMTVEKENLEAIQKMHLKEIHSLQSELRDLKSGTNVSPRAIVLTSETNNLLEEQKNRILELENENEVLKMELEKWKEKYGEGKIEGEEAVVESASSTA
jgi:hypothetical protein